MQLGLPGVTSPAREVEQARLIREAVGPDMELMCDINQRWRVEQAIDIGRRVEDAGVGLYWLEDVTAHDDYPGLARVAEALSTPVAGGEYLWGVVPFRHMLEARSVDYRDDRSGTLRRHHSMAQDRRHGRSLQPAGRQPWRAGDPVHLVGAVPNGLTVEYMPRLFRLFEEVPVPQKGDLVMPAAPGLGLKFDEQAIRRFAVA